MLHQSYIVNDFINLVTTTKTCNEKCIYIYPIWWVEAIRNRFKNTISRKLESFPENLEGQL